MKLALIAALSNDSVIGKGGQLPWRLPADLKRFKQLTTGHVVLMGRKTFDSIGRKPLPDRDNLVVTRSPQLCAATVPTTRLFVLPGIEAALELATQRARAAGVERVFVIGGESLYRELLPRADELFLTRVDVNVPEGDARFPSFSPEQWRRTGSESHPAEEGRPPYAFETWSRAAA